MEIAKYGNVEMPLVNHGGQLWMTAESIGQALEYNEPRKAVMKMYERKRDELEDFSAVVKVTTPGGKQDTTVFNEEGVMMLTMFSNQPRAKDFRKWAVGVLKAYRHGEVQAQPQPGFQIPQSYPEALRLAADTMEKNAQLEKTVQVLTPKVAAFDRLATHADGSLCITNAAKDLQMRPKDLFQWLSANKWIYKRSGGIGWIAYQDRIQSGHLEHKITTVERSDGSEKITEQVLITAKGMAKLSALFSAPLTSAVGGAQ